MAVGCFDDVASAVVVGAAVDCDANVSRAFVVGAIDRLAVVTGGAVAAGDWVVVLVMGAAAVGVGAGQTAHNTGHSSLNLRARSAQSTPSKTSSNVQTCSCSGPQTASSSASPLQTGDVGASVSCGVPHRPHVTGHTSRICTKVMHRTPRYVIGTLREYKTSTVFG